MNFIYDIHDLLKIYPGQTEPANKRISLQIEQGEIFGLLGDNGAGKSTLVKQMVGLVSSTEGTIRLFGGQVSGNPTLVSLNIGYMPQDNRAMNNLTVAEALYFTAHLRGLSRADARCERDELLELWQIGGLRDKIGQRLSGGQARLMQIAVAMAGNPPVLILDEPTNNLDPQRRRLVWDNLNAYNRQYGTTIIFITHDAIEAEKIIQRVGIMRKGELVAVGRLAELKQQIDRKVRLELFFQPDNPPEMPYELVPTILEAGHWLILLEWQQVQSVLNSLNMQQIEDFRLYSATLEDLYLHYATQTTTHISA